MTDLLDQLAGVNPVPACDAPSIDDVWRKLDETAPRDRHANAGPQAARPSGGGLLSRGMRTLPDADRRG